MTAYLHHNADAWGALAPVLVVGLAILGAAVLAFNGGIVIWVLIDQAPLRIWRREATCSLDDLMDSDDWAQANGYATPTLSETDEPWLFEAAEFQTASADRTAAVLFAASVLADIGEWTGGDGAA